MTQLITALSEDLIDAAFARISILPEAGEVAGGRLYRLQVPAVGVALSEAMEKIRSLLKDAGKSGLEAVREKLRTVVDFVEDRAQKLGEWADDLRQAVLAKIHELMQHTYDLVLGSLRPRIKLVDTLLVLESVNLSCKLVFSGSIDVSLTRLCEFTASGESTISAKYTLGTEARPSAEATAIPPAAESN